ncbi:MAG TPA: hypothetical protein VFQ72_04330 [Candidatus Paceibacterota bacterium]|nr:hypothetical protein [Candidatus Paceibacterota bacterium]
MNALDLPVVKDLFRLVIDPVVRLIFAGAVLYFVWGVFKYIRTSDDPGERISGGKHILYGTIGLFIMVSVWGIIAVLEKTWNVR